MPQEHNIYEDLENLKEVHRIQFDYFKHLSTLSMAAIGTIAAFIVKIISISSFILLAVFSLLSFLVCLVVSLFGMTGPTNMVLDLTGMQAISTSVVKEPKELEKDQMEYASKYRIELKHTHICDLIVRYSFIAGVILFLVYVALSMMC